MDQEALRGVIYAVIAVLFVAGALSLFVAVFSFYVWPRSSNPHTKEILHDHFPAVVGLPMISLASFIVVWLFRFTEGPIEVGGMGVTFRGASAPVIFWIMVFLSMVFGLKKIW